MTSVEGTRRLVLREALNLAATYLSGTSVELGTRLPAGERDDSLAAFLDELRGRHALAAAAQLLTALPGVERRLSSVSTLRERTSRGVIRGRLDLPRYIARRTTVTYPREFPIVTTEQSLATPENRLARTAIGALRAQLLRSGLPVETAEGLAAVHLQQRLWRRETSHPWNSVRAGGAVRRLLAETAARVRRRQTGNDVAYGRLVDWARRWTADLTALDTEQVDVIVDGLLAFPAGDQWWDRVFELWTLRAVAEAFQARGWTAEGPAPLHLATDGPVYTLRHGAHAIELLFQRSLFAGHRRWRYVDGAELYGIHDVVVISPMGPPLIVDAKFRWAARETRPEETFKMLGYADNQRLAAGGEPFIGLLVFPGPTGSSRTLVADDDGARLDVVIGDFETGFPQLRSAIEEVMAAWLARLGLPGGETSAVADY